MGLFIRSSISKTHFWLWGRFNIVCTNCYDLCKNYEQLNFFPLKLLSPHNQIENVNNFIHTLIHTPTQNLNSVRIFRLLS